MNKNFKICSKGDISKSNFQMCHSQKVLDSIKAQEKILIKKIKFDHIKIMTEIRCLEHKKQSLILDTQ